jgi:hypothetical protein
MKVSTIFTTLASILPAIALPTVNTTNPSSFGGLAIHSGSPIHLSAINANANSFYLNKPTTSSCPNTTVQVPGGQRVYVAKDGSLGYTIPHGSVSGNQTVTYTGFEFKDSGIHLQYLGEDFIAVPVGGGAYKVYAAAVEGTPKNGTSFAFRVQGVNATFGAWEY